MALVHQRFSTNTFPSWKLAHPYRMVAHNGEINTLRGNVNWMAARQASVSSPLFGDEISKLWPISYEGQSDTACFDNALEFLTMGGYELAHAAMMLIPEAWAGNPLMDEDRRAFYEYHAALMEPWDGPAAIAFTDGRQIAATLDRNGLRPARYIVTDDGLVIMASEVGVLPVPAEKIVTKWRLQPGKMLLIDLEEGRIISDDELKRRLATANPYRQWLAQHADRAGGPAGRRLARAASTNAALLDRQQAFGYTQEDLKLLMAPMATTGQEAVGSMGTDTPVAVLSRKPKLLYNYFKQNFAQVTNPAIDPIREEAVMSLVSFIGPRPNLFDLKGAVGAEAPRSAPADPHQRGSREDPHDRRHRRQPFPDADARHHLCRRSAARTGMDMALTRLCGRAERAVLDGYNIIILSDRLLGAGRVAIPALLATAAVHNHLIRKGLRTSVGLVVETGEAREVHHFCVLAGYGAEAINPYLAFETLLDMHAEGAFPEVVDADEVVYRYIKSIGKGVLKVMSKMGISTYQSYCGAQIFDAIGLSTDFVHRFFFGTSTTIEGVGLAEIAEETMRRHEAAFGEDPVLRLALDVGGEYAYRLRGEDHIWTPEAVALLQHAVRGKGVETYRQYADLHERPGAAELRHPRPLPHQERRRARTRAGADRGGRAGGRDRQALLHRRDELRLDLARGARDAGDRHEPHRRQVEHRRGRRGGGALPPAAERRFQALGHQAGGLGPLRRDDGIPRQFRHDADQDRAGREARRRRPAARPQGRRDDRQGAAFDARRRPDLAAAASRHLFDRGHRAADLRPEERQPGGPGVGEARRRGRRRHGRGRRRQGALRPYHHRRL